MGAKGPTWGFFLNVNSIGEIIQHAVVDGDAGGPVLRRGKTEHPMVQAFVKLAHPGAVEEQDFQCVSSLSKEEKESTAPGLTADSLRHDS